MLLSSGIRSCGLTNLPFCVRVFALVFARLFFFQKVGAAIALALAAKGCRVVISDINVQGGKKLESDLGGTSKCFFVKADISQATERANLVKDGQKWAKDTAIAGKESRDTVISILVNNVGVQHVDPVENFPLERWQLIQDLMLTAPFHLSQMCLPDIYKLGYGRIINIGSIHSLVASVGKAAYVSAKHGLLGLTKVGEIVISEDWETRL